MGERRGIDLLGLISRMNRPWVIIFSFVAVAGIGYLDIITGTELSLSFFYLLPVCLTASVADLWVVAINSAVCSGIWIGARYIGGLNDSTPFVFAWNALMRFGIIFITGYLFNRLVIELKEKTELSLTDSLTGIANRRLFFELLQREISRAQRNERPLTLVYIDVDGFKQINDNIGHAAGDEALRLVASVLKSEVRASDAVGRIGGDEFALLLSECWQQDARKVVEKIRERIGEESPRKLGRGLTLSFGALTTTALGRAQDDLIRSADELMYKVKREGKNGAVFDSDIQG
jgi:diguanylate cyclase (GGDEF) domain